MVATRFVWLIISAVFLLTLISAEADGRSAVSMWTDRDVEVAAMRSASGATTKVFLSDSMVDSGVTFSPLTLNGAPCTQLDVASSNASAALAATADETDHRSTFAHMIRQGELDIRVQFVSSTEVRITFKCPACYAFVDERIWVIFLAPALTAVHSSSRIPIAVAIGAKREQSRLNEPRDLIVAGSAAGSLLLSYFSSGSHSGVTHVSRLSLLARSVECNQMLDLLLNPTQQRFGRGRQAPFLSSLIYNFAIFVVVVLLHVVVLHRFPRVFDAVFPGMLFLLFILLLPGIALAAFETLVVTGAPMRWALAILMFLSVGGIVIMAFVATGPQVTALRYDAKEEAFTHAHDPQFVSRWIVLLQPFGGGLTRLFLVIEIVTTLAIAGFSAADPSSPTNSGCFLRLMGTLGMIGAEVVALFVTRPFAMKLEFTFSAGAKMLELVVVALALGAGTERDPANDFVTAANAMILLGCGIAMLKAIRDVIAARFRHSRRRAAELRRESGDADAAVAAEADILQPLLGGRDEATLPQPKALTAVQRRIVRILNYRYIATQMANPTTRDELIANRDAVLSAKFGRELRAEPPDEAGAPAERNVLLSMRRRGAHRAHSVALVERSHGDEDAALEDLLRLCGPEPPETPVGEAPDAADAADAPPQPPGDDDEMMRRVVRRMNYRSVDEHIRRFGEADVAGIMAAVNEKFGTSDEDHSKVTPLRTRLVMELRARKAHVATARSLVAARADKSAEGALRAMEKQWGPEEPPTPPPPTLVEVEDLGAIAVESDDELERAVEAILSQQSSVFVPRAQSFVSPLRVPSRRIPRAPLGRSLTEERSPGGELEARETYSATLMDFEEFDIAPAEFPREFDLL